MLMARVVSSEESWFILRTAGRSTLLLAKTLAEDGFEVWTPTRTVLAQVPRMNVKREIKLPLLPSFVFVKAAHLPELLSLSRMPVKPRRGEGWGRPAHRDFSVFHYLDQIPMVADRHLEPMRLREAQVVPKSLQKRFDRGDKVRVNSGAFQGLYGRVERSKSGHALVIFDDWRRPVQIPAFLLSEITALSVAKPLTGPAATKAA